MTGRLARLCRAGAGVFCAVAHAISTPIAEAQTLASGRSFEAPFARLFAGLIVCTLVAFVAALLLKRRLSAGNGLSLFSKASVSDTSRRIAVLETRRLSPHADVCRFTSAGREYLVIVAAGVTTLLRDSEIERPAEDAPPEASA
jgi:uncharacterized membrane protein YraQ (UPF0718 family)